MLTATPSQENPTSEDFTPEGQGGGVARKEKRVPQHTTCYFRLKIKSVHGTNWGCPCLLGTAQAVHRVMGILVHSSRSFGSTVQSNCPFSVCSLSLPTTNLRTKRQCKSRCKSDRYSADILLFLCDVKANKRLYGQPAKRMVE